MNPLLHWLTSPEWTHVVGALLHSLWQGAIIALALAVLMRRLANPVTRYRCALAGLGLVFIAGIVTWAAVECPETRRIRRDTDSSNRIRSSAASQPLR